MTKISTKLSGWLFSCAMLVSTAAQANDTSFELLNRSSEPILTVNISPVDASGWGPDLLGKEVILSGRKQFFNPGSSKGCLYDVRVVYQGNREEEQRSVNLCETETLSFNGSGATNPSRSSAGGGATAPQAASYDGTQPLRCGTTVNCRSQAETVQSMQLRWGAFSRGTHYGSTCLDAIRRIRTMHPAAYGSGDPGWVQPQMEICNMR